MRLNRENFAEVFGYSPVDDNWASVRHCRRGETRDSGASETLISIAEDHHVLLTRSSRARTLDRDVYCIFSPHLFSLPQPTVHHDILEHA